MLDIKTKTMKIRRFAMPIMACALLSFMVACENNAKNTANEEPQATEQPASVPVTKVFDYVLDAGTYNELDYDYANTFVNGKYDGWTKACTAVAKTLPNGQTVVGRNMDLYISKIRQDSRHPSDFPLRDDRMGDLPRRLPTLRFQLHRTALLLHILPGLHPPRHKIHRYSPHSHFGSILRHLSLH